MSEEGPPAPRPEEAKSTRFSWHSVALGVGLLLLLGVLWRIGWEGVLRALARCDPRWIGAAALVYVLGQIWRGAKWWYWLRFAQPEARPGPVLSCYLANAFLSNLTPARSGEALAPLLLQERCGASLGSGAAVVTVDRLLDLLALVFWTLLATLYLFFERESDNLLGVEPRLLAMVALVILILGPIVGLRLLRWRLHVEPTARWASKLHRFRSAIDRLVTTPRLVFGFSLTLVGWLFDFASLTLMINAFVPITIVDNAICQTITIWLALLSLIPGGLGVTTVGYATMAHSLGYPWEAVAMGSAVNVVVTNGLRFTLATLAGTRSRATRSRRRTIPVGRDQGQAE